jgi:DNA-binding transcriptional regulator YdaS (Cro superfamily)
MGESPAAFFTMFDGFDDDLFDIELELERRSNVYGRDEVAELVGLSRSSLSQWVKRSHLPAPDHYDDEDRAIWTARQLAPAVAKRRRASA